MPKAISSKHILLPFIYFYVLSFMVILVSAYWLIATPGNIGQTYAQEGEVLASEIVPSISEENNEGEVLSSSSEYCAFGDEKAKKIDNYFKGVNAPLAGQGCNFMREGQINDIEPNLVAAIAMCESTGGQRVPIYNGVYSYNAWGWAVYDSVETVRAVQGHNCDSWEHCIGRVSRGIVAKSEQHNVSLEPSGIVQWYNAGSVNRAGGNPEESTWVKCVENVMKKIASTPEEV